MNYIQLLIAVFYSFISCPTFAMNQAEVKEDAAYQKTVSFKKFPTYNECIRMIGIWKGFSNIKQHVLESLKRMFPHLTGSEIELLFNESIKIDSEKSQDLVGIDLAYNMYIKENYEERISSIAQTNSRSLKEDIAAIDKEFAEELALAENKNALPAVRKFLLSALRRVRISQALADITD